MRLPEAASGVLSIVDRMHGATPSPETMVLLDALPVPVFFKDRQGRHTGMNRAWEEFFGLSRDACIGRTLSDLYGDRPSLAATHEARDAEAWRRPGSVSYEAVLTRADGQTRHVIDYKATFGRAGDGPAGLIGAVFDITDHVRAEQERLESDERFQSLLDLSSDWYWEQDQKLRFTLVSHGIRSSIGGSPEDYLGRTRWETAAIGVSDEEWAAHRAVLEARAPFRDFEYAREGPGGSVVYLSVSGEPVFDKTGAFRGYRGIGKDITRRKAAEARLKEAHQALARKARELTRSNQELEHFAYVASHDLQEPLRMVSSYTQLLARRYAGAFDQDGREFMEFIVDGASRMKQLIEDLLSYSRVGTRGGAPRPVECSAALQDALRNLRGSIDEARAAVTHDALPVVVADRSQLAQIFQNLIGNAIKFAGAGAPRIHVTADRDGAAWTMSVADNGIGIESQYFERIFVMFQRLHGKAEYPGTGIGLAICKKIVDRHGGRLWVESEPGNGSTFRFSLPDRHEGPEPPDDPLPAIAEGELR